MLGDNGFGWLFVTREQETLRVGNNNGTACRAKFLAVERTGEKIYGLHACSLQVIILHRDDRVDGLGLLDVLAAHVSVVSIVLLQVSSVLYIGQRPVDELGLGGVALHHPSEDECMSVVVRGPVEDIDEPHRKRRVDLGLRHEAVYVRACHHRDVARVNLVEGGLQGRRGRGPVLRKHHSKGAVFRSQVTRVVEAAHRSRQLMRQCGAGMLHREKV